MEQVNGWRAAMTPGDVAVLGTEGQLRDPCPQRREALLERFCAALLRETGAARARAEDDAPAAAESS